MSELSNHLETALINATLRNTAYTSPATVYVALFTTDPTDAASGTEVTGGSYARTSVAFAAPSNGVSLNSADCTFPTCTAAWGTVTHMGLRDASTAGNLLYHSPLDDSKSVGIGDVFKITTGNLSVTLA